LIVRLGALGDLVHAIPVAAALRRAFPSARIDWLVAAKHRALLDLVPVIDRRLAMSSLAGAVSELRRGGYDAAIDLQGLMKSAALARLSGAPRVVGFAARHLRERLARVFYTDAYDPGGPASYDRESMRHVIRLNLSLLEPLGASNTAVEFPIDAVTSVIAQEAQAGGPYALINPGASWPNKRWPADRFGEVARALALARGVRPIVIWGPGEEALASAVVDASGRTAVLAPPTTIADLVALSRGARLMVSGDTGPLHLAAAVGTPIVAIYGPTRPARNGPWAAEDVTVSRDAMCQCLHERRCRLQTMCLLDIQTDEVAGAVERRLAADEPRA
jgi:lipopolysaccharide heptosyltransferase I